MFSHSYCSMVANVGVPQAAAPDLEIPLASWRHAWQSLYPESPRPQTAGLGAPNSGGIITQKDQTANIFSFISGNQP